MTDLTPDKLDQIEKAAKEATPGPWEVYGVVGKKCAGVGQPKSDEAVFEDPCVALEDARHIATMDPATTLALVARVRELEAQRFEAVAILHDPRTYAGSIRDKCLKALGEES